MLPQKWKARAFEVISNPENRSKYPRSYWSSLILASMALQHLHPSLQTDITNSLGLKPNTFSIYGSIFGGIVSNAAFFGSAYAGLVQAGKTVDFLHSLTDCNLDSIILGTGLTFVGLNVAKLTYASITGKPAYPITLEGLPIMFASMGAKKAYDTIDDRMTDN
jgi:hypothetical protein